jgi:hypothetical protein
MYRKRFFFWYLLDFEGPLEADRAKGWGLKIQKVLKGKPSLT